MNSPIRLAIPALLFATLAAAGCSSGEAQDAPPTPPAPEVTASRVLFDEVRDWAEFTGRLEPVESVELRPRVGGYVETVDFVEGAEVQQGDRLFRIDAEHGTLCARIVSDQVLFKWKRNFVERRVLKDPPTADALARMDPAVLESHYREVGDAVMPDAPWSADWWSGSRRSPGSRRSAFS